MDFVGFYDSSGVILVYGFAGLYSTTCGALNDDCLAISLGEDKLVLVFGIGLSYLEADEFKLTAVLSVLLVLLG